MNLERLQSIEAVLQRADLWRFVTSIGVDCGGSTVFVSKPTTEAEPEPVLLDNDPIEPEKVAEDEATHQRKEFVHDLLAGLPHCRVPEFER